MELADTPEKRSLGLMYRKRLPTGKGMLFYYAKPKLLTFWMKNTKIPLSIGFFAKDKRLVDIQQMPLGNPLKQYRSSIPCMYALEVPLGWFKKKKIKPGALLKIF